MDEKQRMNDSERSTWDGKLISAEAPFGATVIVRHRSDSEPRYLILHRAHAGENDDWAWTPPSGARFPSEPIDECARRELLEETGLTLEIIKSEYGSEDWFVYIADYEAGSRIVLSNEHDHYEWVPIEQAISRCRPERVTRPFRLLK
jgi:8-oxo-dGTP pyrophosphatase MutT (NUDIX family)